MVKQGSYLICVWKVKNVLGLAVFLLVLILRQTGSFSVTDPFLTTFYYVKKRNGILHKNKGEAFYVHRGRGGVKNCQNQPYIINEWPLITSNNILPMISIIPLLIYNLVLCLL